MAIALKTLPGAECGKAGDGVDFSQISIPCGRPLRWPRCCAQRTRSKIVAALHSLKSREIGSQGRNLAFKNEEAGSDYGKATGGLRQVASKAGGGPPKSLRAIIFSLAANIRICLTFKSVASAALRTAQTSTRSKA
ncbi:hypothetical protein [Mesorhizobium sp.]|uniref:hypothetical protein n=1 Tax=Mesorhizobium sp. TaxID=1871066 RepID=UPI0025CE5C25|nr:hypothetical protein [Mesorhizobium sp.]